MKQAILGIIIGALAVFLFFEMRKKETPEHQTTVVGLQTIQEKLNNVSKLVVTEGYFSDIITYSDVKSYYSDWFTAEKKAVVLVKAKATLSYDLSMVAFKYDNVNKTIELAAIPKPEIQITPDLNYYDIESDYLNPFGAEDYNKISDLVNERLEQQISNSSFKTNGANRLVSELYNLLHQMGYSDWRLVYDFQSQEVLNVKK